MSKKGIIYDLVDENEEIEFGVMQKTNVIGHCGISVSFNGTLMVTIDFGTDENSNKIIIWSRCSRATSSFRIVGCIGINELEQPWHKKKKIIFSIKLFSIRTETSKRQIKLLIEKLLSIPMGEY